MAHAVDPNLFTNSAEIVAFLRVGHRAVVLDNPIIHVQLGSNWTDVLKRLVSLSDQFLERFLLVCEHLKVHGESLDSDLALTEADTYV